LRSFLIRSLRYLNGRTLSPFPTEAGHRQDAQHILRLLLKDDFPRIWVPSWENRDLRQLLWHRHRLVQARTQIMNQLPTLSEMPGYFNYPQD